MTTMLEEVIRKAYIAGAVGRRLCLDEEIRKLEREYPVLAAAPQLREACKELVAIWEGPRERAALRFAAAIVNTKAAIAAAEKEE